MNRRHFIQNTSLLLPGIMLGSSCISGLQANVRSDLLMMLASDKKIKQ